MTKITAAELLTYALNESGLKTSFVAKKYGITVQAINKWKRGDFCPKYDDLCGILEYLGFDMAELIIELRNK